MRNKLIAMIVFLIGLSFLTIGIVEGQYELISVFYKQKSAIP